MPTVLRVRLVIALGMLNLVLVTVALAIGSVAPTNPGPGGIAGGQTSQPSGPLTGAASRQPSPSPQPASPTPGSSTGGGPSPTGGGTAPSPSPEPSASEVPSASPQGSPAASLEPSVPPASTQTNPPSTPRPPASVVPARPSRPSPTPERTPRPTATPVRTPQPTSTPTQPTLPPPATPKARPPCPGSVDGPPGHHKTTGPVVRPCGHGRGHNGDEGKAGWLVVLFPLSGSSAVSWRLPGRRGRRRPW